MSQESWKICWNEYASDTYLYGSEIIYHGKDSVDFKNPLMPPGTVIKQWYSRTNYQAKKIEPSLPMIDGESMYEIDIHIDSAEKGVCLVRLVFYDRYETEAGSIVIRDQKAVFRCPLKTYSYCMQLISGGIMEFRFHSIVIREIDNGTE